MFSCSFFLTKALHRASYFLCYTKIGGTLCVVLQDLLVNIVIKRKL